MCPKISRRSPPRGSHHKVKGPFFPGTLQMVQRARVFPALRAGRLTTRFPHTCFTQSFTACVRLFKDVNSNESRSRSCSRLPASQQSALCKNGEKSALVTFPRTFVPGCEGASIAPLCRALVVFTKRVSIYLK